MRFGGFFFAFFFVFVSFLPLFLLPIFEKK